MYNYNNLISVICLDLLLEAQIPGNVIDQMKESLVNCWNLPDNSSIGRVSAMKEEGSLKTYPPSIQQHLPVESSFACWMEHRQVEVSHNEGRIRFPQPRYSQAGSTSHGLPGYHLHYSNWRWNRVDCWPNAMAFPLGHSFHAVCAEFLGSWKRKEEWSIHIYNQEIQRNHNIKRKYVCQ